LDWTHTHPARSSASERAAFRETGLKHVEIGIGLVDRVDRSVGHSKLWIDRAIPHSNDQMSTAHVWPQATCLSVPQFGNQMTR
jgi:hypothetical protein